MFLPHSLGKLRFNFAKYFLQPRAFALGLALLSELLQQGDKLVLLAPFHNIHKPIPVEVLTAYWRVVDSLSIINVNKNKMLGGNNVVIKKWLMFVFVALLHILWCGCGVRMACHWVACGVF